MGKSVLSKGKTVQEAVSLALSLLRSDHDEVDIEVVEQATKGILGIGMKPAVVRVTAKDKASGGDLTEDPFDSIADYLIALEPAPANPLPAIGIGGDIADPDAELSGKIWVKDSYIAWKNAPGKYPVVTFGGEIRLFRNDEPVKSTLVVYEGDLLRVELQDDIVEPKWEIVMNGNKTEAFLKIVPGYKLFKRLKDTPPSAVLRIEVEEKKVPTILDTEPIIHNIKELGIAQAIDFSEVAKACTSEVVGSFIIAKGTPPIPGQHGIFKPMQEIEIKKGLKERSNGTVDYREIQEFPSVDQGQVIGVVLPPVPGTYGVTVTNEPILPPEVRPMILKAGKGVVLVDDETKAVAVESGHPEVILKGQSVMVSVVPKLKIGKDVDLKTGNVRFRGDVEIAGNVQDGMVVDARGNVHVKANLHSARIAAGKSVIVEHNIIGSNVTAGNGSLWKAEMARTLENLIVQMEQMSNAIQQLSQVSAFKVNSFTRTGLGPLIKILGEGKFKSFFPLIKELHDKYKDGTEEFGEDWTAFCERMAANFQAHPTSVLQSAEEFHELIGVSKGWHQILACTDEESDCFIKTDFAHNSILFSSGDISVVGQGCYQSKLHAEGFVVIEGSVLGGEVYGAKGVQIGEAGSKGGAATCVSASEEAVIRIDLVRADTTIRIGSRMHKFMTDSTHIEARLDQNGSFRLS